MTVRELMGTLSLKVPRPVWLQILRAIAKVQAKSGVDPISPLDYLKKKQLAQKVRLKKRLQEKLQLMGHTEDDDAPPPLAPSDSDEGEGMDDFDVADAAAPQLPVEAPPAQRGQFRMYDFSAVVGIRVSENDQLGTVIGGRLDP